MIFGIYIRRMMFALKILIYALGLICQVMRCVGHDLRPRSTMRVTEQYIGGALGAYGKMIARKS